MTLISHISIYLTLFLIFISSIYAGGNVNPLDFVVEEYAFIAAIPNPNPLSGDMVGADAFNNGQDFGIVWGAGGDYAFYHQGDYDGDWYLIRQSACSAPDFATGIMEVPEAIYGGSIAISCQHTIYFYDWDGNEVNTWDVDEGFGSIIDISYDIERDRIIVSAELEIGELQQDGTIIPLGNFLTQTDGFEMIDMTDDGQNIIDDMYQQSSTFYRMYEDGIVEVDDPVMTNLGEAAGPQGIAYTENYAIIPVSAGFLVIYDANDLEFMEYINHDVNPPLDPVIELITPLNNEVLNDVNVEFIYNVSGPLIDSCSLFLDGVLNQTEETIDTNVLQLFVQELQEGDHTWQTSCVNELAQETFSEIRNVTISMALPPEVTLITPEDLFTETLSNDIIFTYNVSGEATEICNLLIDTVVAANSTEIVNDVPQFFNHSLENGLYQWAVSCTDTLDQTGFSLNRTLTVDVNHAPIFDILENQMTDENQTLMFTATATDVDEDKLFYEVQSTSINSEFNFDSSTGEFIWTPTFEEAGIYDIIFNVTDGELSDEISILITVNDVSNLDILLISPPDKHIEDTTNDILFEYVVSGAEISSCSLLVNNTIMLTDNKIEVDVTQMFEETLFKGFYLWQVSCTDTFESVGLSEIRSLTITFNNPPFIDPIEDQIINENDTLIIQPIVNDPDQDDLIFSIDTDITSEFDFDILTGEFNWTPTFEDAGIYNAEITVSDGEEMTQEAFAIEVLDVPLITTITLDATGDSFIYQRNTWDNEGGNDVIRINAAFERRLWVQSFEPWNRRVLVNFDLEDISTENLIDAKLIFTIKNITSITGDGRELTAHRLLKEWEEGDGNDDSSGTGAGVTWKCPIDTDISNEEDDCLGSWSGGSFSQDTGEPVLHTNEMEGEIEYDVLGDIEDVEYGWLIKKDKESMSGVIQYYSKETELGPRLVLTYLQ